MYLTCAKCGKRISIEEIDNNTAISSGGNLYCAECAKELSTLEAKVTIEEEPQTEVQGTLTCARCGRVVLPEQIAAGSAIKTAEGKAYCVECIAIVMPLFEALSKEASSSEDSHNIPVVNPVVEMRPRPLIQEQERPTSSPIPLALVLVGVLLIIIIIALSSGGGGSSTKIDYGSKAGGEIPRMTYENSSKIMSRLDSLKQRWSSKPEEYNQIMNELREILSLSLSPDVRYAVESFRSNMTEEQEQIARHHYDSIVGEMRRLANEGRYDDAVREADKFPLWLKDVGDYWSRLKAEADSFSAAKDLLREYGQVNSKADALLKEKRYEEALKLLEGFSTKAEGTPLKEKENKTVSEVLRLKEEADKKRLTAEWDGISKEVDGLIAKKDFDGALKRIDEFSGKSGEYLKAEYEAKRRRIEELAKAARIEREKERWNAAQTEIDGLLNSKRYEEAMKKVEEFVKSDIVEVEGLATEKMVTVWRKALATAEQLAAAKRFEEAQKIVEPFTGTTVEAVALEAQKFLERIEELKTASKPPDKTSGQDDESVVTVDARLELVKIEQIGELKHNVYRLHITRPEGGKVVNYKLLKKVKVEASIEKKIGHPFYLLSLPDCTDIEKIIAEIELEQADKQYARFAHFEVDGEGGFFTDPLVPAQYKFLHDLSAFNWFEINKQTNEQIKHTSDLRRTLRLPGEHKLRCFLSTCIETGAESWVSLTLQVTYTKPRKGIIKRPIEKPPKKEPSKTPPQTDDWYILFEKGESLRWWKSSAEGIWSVKDNELIGKNNTTQEQFLVTDFPGCEKWFDMEVQIKVMLISGKWGIGLRRTANKEAGGWLRSADNAPRNAWEERHFRLTGSRLEEIRGTNSVIITEQFEPQTPGGIMILLSPGTEIKLEYIKVKVLSTK